MLSLRRKEGQEIEISGTGTLRITLLRIEGQQVQLAFSGDRAMHVVRAELLGKNEDHPKAA